MVVWHPLQMGIQEIGCRIKLLGSNVAPREIMDRWIATPIDAVGADGADEVMMDRDNTTRTGARAPGVERCRSNGGASPEPAPRH